MNKTWMVLVVLCGFVAAAGLAEAGGKGSGMKPMNVKPKDVRAVNDAAKTAETAGSTASNAASGDWKGAACSIGAALVNFGSVCWAGLSKAKSTATVAVGGLCYAGAWAVEHAIQRACASPPLVCK